MSVLLEKMKARVYLGSMGKEFGARVRRLREARGLAMKELAHVADRTESWMSNLETGKIERLPSYDVVVRWAALLGVGAEELASGVGLAPAEPLSVVLARIGAEPLDEEPPIPLDQPVAAGRRGAGIVQGSDDLARRRRRRHEPRRYLVRIEGDCLEPRASRGDYAVFDPEQPAENGDLVVIAHGDQALVKYLAEQDSVQWLLPLAGEPIELLPEMRIVGVVKEIRRGPGRAPGVPRGG